MKNSIHRINDYTLLKFADLYSTDYFYSVKDQINLEANHFVNIGEENSESIVWENGDYKYRLNKTYSSLMLFDPQILTNSIMNFIDVKILLRQGFNWYDIFGIHVILKSTKTGDVLYSQMLFPNNFQITQNKELIDGAFWVEEASIKIPKTEDILSAQITIVKNDDIISVDGPNIGYVYNFPTEFIPLIDEKPLPEYISNKISLDENHYLKIEVTTTENKTVQKSILDYFETDYADIQIEHIINYGNDTYGFKKLAISNKLDQYLPINIGLNLKSFDQSIVNIFVSTEIYVDNKLMKRETQINTDLSTINPFLTALIENPITNFPVEVKKENVINNTVIEANTTTKLMPIYQPVFAEFISGDLKIEAKNIYFEKLTKEAYLRINSTIKDIEQLILSSQTSDGKIYFDLSQLTPNEDKTTYVIVDSMSKKIIGRGNVVTNY